MFRPFAFILSLSVLVGLATVPGASATVNDNAKIAAHLVPRLVGGTPSCADAPTPACNAGQPSLNVQGLPGTVYDMYLVVLDGDADEGVAGASFGITYGSDVYVGDWRLCADLQFPGGPSGISWPASGSGNLVTWNPQGNCQESPAPNDADGGVTAVIGAFYVYAYDSDEFAITRREYATTPDFQVTDCSASTYNLLYPGHAGRVGFGVDLSGYDPCFGVDPEDAVPSYDPGEVMTMFRPNLVEPPVGSHEGTLDDFGFADPALYGVLNGLGVTHLRKVVPWFTHESVSTETVHGEPVTLTHDLTDLYLLSLSDTSVAQAVVSLTGDTAHVVFAEPNFVRQTTSVIPSDPKFPQQWWLNNDNDGEPWTVDGVDVNAPEAWEHGTPPAVRVAVLDTGIDYNQQGELGSFVQGPNFAGAGNSTDFDGHGTAVAGIIGARANNGINGAGIHWTSQLLAVKVCEGGCDDDDIVAGIDWARTNAARVINMSLGGPSFGAAILAALKNTQQVGILNVAAMGNSNDNTQHYPASLSGVVTAVGAVWADNKRWEDAALNSDWNCTYQLQGNCQSATGCGSAFGDWIDLAAPGGRSILTTDLAIPNPTRVSRYNEVNGPCFDGFGGTSAAAPVVSGVASFILGLHPQLDGDDVHQILIRTADDVQLYGMGFDQITGYGRVNAERASEFLLGSAVEAGTVTAMATHTVNNRTMQFNDVPGLASSTNYFTKEYELRGTVSFSFAFLGTPTTWAKTSRTIGWSNDNPHEGRRHAAGYAEVLAGSVTSSGLTVRTYVYQVFDAGGGVIGWFPTDPASARAAWTAVGPSSVTGIGDNTGTPRLLTVQALGNPLVDKTLIRFSLPGPAQAELEVFDLAGRMVKTLAIGEFPSGVHYVEWDATDVRGVRVPSGVYFYRLASVLGTETKKLTVLR